MWLYGCIDGCLGHIQCFKFPTLCGICSVCNCSLPNPCKNSPRVGYSWGGWWYTGTYEGLLWLLLWFLLRIWGLCESMEFNSFLLHLHFRGRSLQVGFCTNPHYPYLLEHTIQRPCFLSILGEWELLCIQQTWYTLTGTTKVKVCGCRISLGKIKIIRVQGLDSKMIWLIISVH